MGLRLAKFPEHGLTLRIASGAVEADEVIRCYEELDATCGPRWLTYIDVEPSAQARADVVDVVPVDRLPEIKRVIARKTKELFRDKPTKGAVVCRSKAYEETVKFWRAYVAAGEEHPPETAFFTSLEAACAWLELSDAARAAVVAAIQLRTPADGASADKPAARRGSTRREAVDRSRS